ncbi:MAG: hypothetical protein FWD27_02605 [Coriobacteriia bacterium]|nr:hypothetical protein [Coriobacteriia bacterium]
MAYTKETLLEVLLDDPEGMEIAETILPGKLNNPMIGMVKKMPLEKVAAFPQAGLSPEDLDKLIEALNNR